MANEVKLEPVVFRMKDNNVLVEVRVDETAGTAFAWKVEVHRPGQLLGYYTASGIAPAREAAAEMAKETYALFMKFHAAESENEKNHGTF